MGPPRTAHDELASRVSSHKVHKRKPPAHLCCCILWPRCIISTNFPREVLSKPAKCSGRSRAICIACDQCRAVRAQSMERVTATNRLLQPPKGNYTTLYPQISHMEWGHLKRRNCPQRRLRPLSRVLSEPRVLNWRARGVSGMWEVLSTIGWPWKNTRQCVGSSPIFPKHLQ